MTNLAAETQARIASYVAANKTEDEYLEDPAVISHDCTFITITEYGIERASPHPRSGGYVSFIGADLDAHQIFYCGNPFVWRGETVEEMARNLAADLSHAVYRAPTA